MTKAKESKRILSVTVKRMIDDSPDTSWLGEFSDEPGDYSIVHVGQHSGELVSDVPCTCGHLDHSGNLDELCGAPVEGMTCDCDYYQQDLPERGREFRYFNPVAENYKDEAEEDIRKQVKRDYDRMASLVRGDWCFMGVGAEAQIQLQQHGVIQTITSGGLWGIESDSGDYFKEVETEQLAELKTQLRAIGFSTRAISAAYRNVEHKDE